MRRMKHLTIKFEKKPNPFLKEQNGSQYDLWGEIILSYGDKILLNCEWEMCHLILDFIEKKESFLYEKFPFDYNNSIEESCARERNKIIDSIDNASEGFSGQLEAELDKVLNYIFDHSFYLPGTTTQSFSIGLNPEGLGEISYYLDNEDMYYKHIFDMPTFIEQANQEIVNYLKKFKLALETDKRFLKEYLGDYYNYVGKEK